jgi:TetR/AcrR family transcriptional regulator, cholesterol catabolism regulator
MTETGPTTVDRTAPTQQQPDGSTSSRVVRTAADLFRRKGYASSTTRELAGLLGIQKASLYHHIDSKEDLLYAICLEGLRSIQTEVTAAIDAVPPRARLLRAIQTHVVSALRDRDMHTVMLIELRALSAERYAAVTEKRSEYESILQHIIAEDQRAGELRRDIDEKYLTLSLLNLLNWTIFWFNPEGEMTAEQLADLLGRLYLDGARQR